MLKGSNSYRIAIVCAFFIIYFVWGTTYLAIVIGLKEFPPFMMATLRFLIAGTLLISYSRWKGESWPAPITIWRNSYVGFLVLIGGQGLLFWSEQHIASGYASVLVATIPFWFILTDRKNWTYYFANPYILIGLVLGFGGIILLFYDQSQLNGKLLDSSAQIWATSFVLLGSICWVVGSMVYKASVKRGSMISNLGWQLLTASVVSALISFTFEDWPINGLGANMTSWAAVIYLAIAGSILAFIAYTWLLQEVPAAIVGSYAYVNPVVAVILGYFWASEVITDHQLWAMAVILIGAIMINLNRTPKKA